MKYLVVYAHPNPKSFNHAVLELVQNRLKKAGKDFAVRDLYNLKFNPVLAGADFMAFKQGKPPADIAEEQKLIREADIIIFIYPIWWFGLPAILKGYIDRVFSYGFAYQVTDKGAEGLLKGKQVIILNTTGGLEENYQKFGFQNALKTTTEAGIFEFCGMKVIGHKYCFAVPTVTDGDRKKMLADLEAMTL